MGGTDLALLFERESTELIRSLPVEGRVASVEFSPDGAELAVAAADTVYVFETNSGALLESIAKPSANVTVPLSARYSPAGEFLAVADVARIDIWNRPSAGAPRSIDAEIAWSADRMAFGPDASNLLVRTAEGVDRVDLSSGTTTSVYEAPTILHGAVATGPELIAAGDDAGRVLVWRGESALPVLETSLTGKVESMAFSQDGTLLAAASANQEGDLHVWEVATGIERLRQNLAPFLGEPFGGIGVRFHQAQDLVFANDGYRAFAFELDASEPIVSYGWGHAGYFSDAAVSPDQQWLASSARDKIIVWGRDDESVVSTISPPGVSGEVVFSPDSTLLYSTVQGTLFEWEPATGVLLRQTPELHRSMISDLDVSPDGAHLAAGVMANEFMILDAPTLEPTVRIPAPDSFASHVVFAPDSKAFVGVKNQREVAAWDVGSGAEIAAVSIEGDVGGILFAVGGTRLVVAARYSVRVYAWPDLELLHSLTRHEAVIFALLPVDDNHVLSFGGDNRRVVLWDIAGGRAISEGATDDSGVPRIALPPEMSVALLMPRANSLRTYCNSRQQPLTYFRPPR